MSNAVLTQYDEQKDLYETFTQKMASLIREILSGSGINIHSVTQRTKDRKSLAKKLTKPNSSYQSVKEVTDISAVRITTYFADDVDRVVAILADEFLIDEDNSVDKRALLDPDRFGYLSTHHVATLSVGRCRYPEYRRFDGLKFEIQTRSILQHAWAEIEHDLGYKSMLEVPKEIRRRFSRLSGLLELADSEFLAIRDQLNAYSRKVLEDITEAPGAVEINKDALLAFAQNDITAQRLDKLIAEVAGWKLATLPEKAARQVDALILLGLETIADLRAALESNQERVATFAKAWLAANERFISKGDNVGVGISCFYLGYVLASDQGKLSSYLEALNVTAEGREAVVKELAETFKKLWNVDLG